MNLTPAMRQYLDIKEQYPDCILFFRMGDFYEMFFEDAVVASNVLEITLTSRNKGREDSVPLCGIPYHAASGYLAKLIEGGFKVAICEQMEDPRETKGLVKREVVRVVTPGLVMDADNLSEKENNYIAAWYEEAGRYGLAFLDLSTGEFNVTETDDRETFTADVFSLGFKEVLLSSKTDGNSGLEALAAETRGCMVTRLDSSIFDYEEARTVLREQFPGDATRDVDLERYRSMTRAAGALVRYVRETQREGPAHVRALTWYHAGDHLVLDETARRNLELFATIQDNRKEGSLVHVLDKTVTAMGGRRLRRWMTYPLVSPGKIGERLAAVAEFKEDPARRSDIRGLLSRVYDLERLGSRVSMGVANGRDLVALGKSLGVVPALKDMVRPFNSPLPVSIVESMDDCDDVARLVERAIVDAPPLSIREGSLIKGGYDPQLDELVSMSMDGKRWIAAMEERERKKTGIGSLKIGFNNVFGYYIEVTKANSGLVPHDYVRKQTLVNAERYINEELKRYEEQVLNAEERRREREYDLFVEVREKIAREIARVQKTASLVADLDVLHSLAEVADLYGYCCPRVDDGDVISIREGRHAVVERMNLDDGFVANDTFLDRGANRFLIITGPNMAGKSTYIRQTALIVLLAQMGSFVPADSAEIGVVDRIFTRVGAGDSLARGRSTFMVEMMEVASILKNATAGSLILLDEVGRGTSTFDGLSIAWAVSEYIHDSERIGARTLFATHYHELTDIARTREGVKNYSIAVKEWGDRIIFLRRIVAGGTNRSYGIQVARLAGVPEAVLTRAREVLRNLERGELNETGLPKIADGRGLGRVKNPGQLSLFVDEGERVLRDIRELDTDTLTPLDALSMISLWKDRLKQ
ncbi:MAG: DNA mismatch repair protein MutS [Syntrophales bacterium]|jgi:DNA mismatch repair protein MutS|nr:DNA mismatch repair protein MutS [Syntrophales bacterium]MCK9527350.1 DNA mismatch repair protein MutS [Syntrophales bacterium]MDX9921180.1 DNA mismatch repair protein MutS [Syntrophales bacterium]